MSGYVWYSSGSDVTGPKLAEALDFHHGKKTPDFDKLDILVGWGCRAESRQKYNPEDLRSKIAQGEIRVLNHPSHISQARNKLALLTKLQAKGIRVPAFINVAGRHPSAGISMLRKAVDEGELILPCLGMNQFHKGRPVFCWTKEDLEKVVLEGATKEGGGNLHYFRSLLQGTEYRIQIFREEALGIEVKALSKDPVAASASNLLAELKKQNQEATQATEGEIRIVVSMLAEDLLRGPSHMLKSVQHGWEWREIAAHHVPAQAISTAISAIYKSGLDMGAVNVVMEEGQPLVTNVISAPGLDEKMLSAYVAAIKDFAKGGVQRKKKKENPAAADEAAAAAAGSEGARPELIAKITRKLRLGNISEEQAEEILKALE
ncbi:MAG: hypothetical protein GF334_03710 [Candidatus Altiarchaeales archaeon]|nr:hypothetical protein [Candidatus Altiarchaeales archaeon]